MADRMLIALLLLGFVAVATSVTCNMYCEGNDDPTGACQNATAKMTCTGAACTKVHWIGSDTTWRGCQNAGDEGGLYPGKCHEGPYNGDQVKACQCDDADMCNAAWAPSISIPLVLVVATIGAMFHM